KAGLGDIGYPAIDDDAGVQNLVALLTLLLPTEDAAQSRQIEQVALVSSDDQAHIGHEQHYQDLKKALGMSVWDAGANDEGKEICSNNPHDAANHGTYAAPEANPMKTPFE